MPTLRSRIIQKLEEIIYRDILIGIYKLDMMLMELDYQRRSKSQFGKLRNLVRNFKSFDLRFTILIASFRLEAYEHLMAWKEGRTGFPWVCSRSLIHCYER